MAATPISDSLADVDLDGEHDYPADPIDLDAGEITALQRADWHLRHLRVIRRRTEEIEAIYGAEIRRLEERRDAELAKLYRAAAWHAKPCHQLHEAILERDPRRKTINLPNGTLKARTETADRVTWVDEDQFVEWARVAAPELVPPRYKPDKRAVAKAFDTRQGACPCVAEGPRYSNVGNPNHDGSPDPCDDCDSTGVLLVWVTEDGEVVPGILPDPGPHTTYSVSVGE